MNYQAYHKHSFYSNVITPDSTMSPKDYALRTEELGQSLLSSVEHGWQGRYIEYYELAKEHNLKYIITTKNEAGNEELINKIVQEIQGEKIDMHNLSTITILEYESKENYFTIMENNIKVLEKVLPRN